MIKTRFRLDLDSVKIKNKSFIKNDLEGDYTLVHYGIAIACFLSLFEPFVLICYKSK